MGKNSRVSKKQCSKCKQVKSIDLFYKNKKASDGHHHYCKKCLRISCQETRQRNKSKARKQRKNWKLKNPDKVTAINKKYRDNNREKVRTAQRLWSKNNPEKEREKQAKKRLCPKFRMMASIRSSVCHCLQGTKNGRRWEVLVGYTLNQLKTHIEELFVGGMNWSNYGEWHIDHIIPVSFFKFRTTDDVEFKMCWRLKNLQPLWAKDNLRKGNKILRRN